MRSRTPVRRRDGRTPNRTWRSVRAGPRTGSRCARGGPHTPRRTSRWGGSRAGTANTSFVSLDLTLRFPGPAEKAAPCLRRLLERLFRKEMSGLDRMALNILAPLMPNGEWSASVEIPGIKCSSSTPQRQYRRSYTPSYRPIGFVVLAIEGRGGSILLADGVDVHGISKSLDIRCAHLRREHR